MESNLPQDQNLEKNTVKHVWLTRIFILIGFFVGIYLALIILGGIFKKTGVINYLSAVDDFIFTPQSKIGSINKRTNILILGKAGKGSTAPDLTDTIIFASVSHIQPSITLISLPRDIWIPALRAKLNSAYYWGNQRRIGGGLVLVKSTTKEIVGEPIQHALVIDYSGFKKLIDVLGGVDINIDRSFVDEKFPILGRENDLCDGDKEFKCRYETLRFAQGKQSMNGETALKFVRSRNAQGDEGTDIAREQRQQKVISAVKAKVLNPRTFFNPVKDLQIWKVVRESIETDINSSGAAILVRRVIQSGKNISSDIIPKEFLVNPPISSQFDYQYVFVPRKGRLSDGRPDWSEIESWVDNLLR